MKLIQKPFFSLMQRPELCFTRHFIGSHGNSLSGHSHLCNHHFQISFSLLATIGEEKGLRCRGWCRFFFLFFLFPRIDAFYRTAGFTCRCHKGTRRVRGQVGRKIMAGSCEWQYEEGPSRWEAKGQRGGDVNVGTKVAPSWGDKSIPPVAGGYQIAVWAWKLWQRNEQVWLLASKYLSDVSRLDCDI